MRTRIAAPAAVAALACAALPTAADAAVVSVEGSTLVYTAAPGEQNSLRVSPLGTSVVDLLEQTSTRLVSRTPACTFSGTVHQPDRSLRCGLSGITRLDVRLGDGDDSFGSSFPIEARVDAGSGDDFYAGILPRIAAGVSQVAFHGGAGRDEASYQQVTGTEGVIVSKDGLANDGPRGGRDDIRPDVEVLRGSGQADVLSGSSNADVFRSTGGDDLLLGNNGDDLFLMGAVDDGPTRVIGGPDRDTVTYAERDRRISVSADNSTSTDGEAGEGDRIEGSEVIEGGSLSDALFTTPDTTVGYRLIGLGGNDILSSANGRDRLIGGPGEDTLASGGDRDTIEARDGERDARVDCGTGDDTAFLDFADSHSGCDTPLRPNITFIGRVGLTEAVRPLPDGTASATLSWEHPVAWRRLRAIDVRVHDGERDAGRLTIRPGDGRVRERGLRLVPGSRMARSGRRVTARLELRLPAVRAGALTADIVATDTAGRRQAETRSIAITERTTR